MSSEPTVPPSSNRPRRSILSIALAFLMLVGVCLLLTVLTMGWFAPVIAIAGMIFLIVAVHYLVWGWWLGAAIQKEAESGEADQGHRKI